MIKKLKNLKTIIFIVLFLFSLFTHFSLVANSFHSVSLDQCLQKSIRSLKELERKNQIDGKVIIAKGDQILLSAQSKSIHNNQKEPQFMIGSLSKQFFAVALLKVLYDKYPHENELLRINHVKKQLRLPLSHFLPSNSSVWKGHMPRWANQVTVEELLNHTSGIPNYTESEKYTGITKNGKYFFENQHPKNEIIRLVTDDYLLFKPGTQFYYSNTNYVIIAELLEVLSGKPASVYLQEALFDPLHLTSTFNPQSGHWFSLKESDQFSSLAPEWYYNPKNKMTRIYHPSTSIDISNAIGSGSIISTTSDLLKWNLALHRGNKIISRGLYQLMIAPNDYGFGIQSSESGLGQVLSHDGIIDTYHSYSFYFPLQDLSIIFMSNIDSDSDESDDENQEIAYLEKINTQKNEITPSSTFKNPNEGGFNQILELVENNFRIETF